MIPDYLIIDEIKRRREETAWEPEPLRLPLYAPLPPSHKPEEDEDHDDSGSRVIIIDM